MAADLRWGIQAQACRLDSEFKLHHCRDEAYGGRLSDFRDYAAQLLMPVT